MSLNLMEPGRDNEPPELEPGEALVVLLWTLAFLLGFIELAVGLAEWLAP